MATRRKAGRRWRVLAKQVLFEENYICHLCGMPGADSADHLIPVSVEPALEYVRENIRAAHKFCNFSRGNRPIPLRQPLNTSRNW